MVLKETPEWVGFLLLFSFSFLYRAEVYNNIRARSLSKKADTFLGGRNFPAEFLPILISMCNCSELNNRINFKVAKMLVRSKKKERIFWNHSEWLASSWHMDILVHV